MSKTKISTAFSANRPPRYASLSLPSSLIRAMKMPTAAVFFLASFAFAADGAHASSPGRSNIGAADQTGRGARESGKSEMCICTADYAPVCGKLKDGRTLTFSNTCRAGCEGALVVRKGKC